MFYQLTSLHTFIIVLKSSISMHLIYKSFDDFLILADYCLCQKRTMYLSIMFSLNNLTKKNMQGDVQCISCS